MGFNSVFKGLKLLKTPGDGRLNNLNDPVLNVVNRQEKPNKNEGLRTGHYQGKSVSLFWTRSPTAMTHLSRLQFHSSVAVDIAPTQTDRQTPTLPLSHFHGFETSKLLLQCLLQSNNKVETAVRKRLRCKEEDSCLDRTAELLLRWDRCMRHVLEWLQWMQTARDKITSIVSALW